MRICLVGNQNSGKTTLFNCLTGMNQKIGNWPGVTIEKKTGCIKGTSLELVDLPGIYSLNPYTEEEKVSSNYILKERPNIIINIIDATCLERSLYLTTQLLGLNAKVIVALNMTDMLAKKGMKIDVNRLQKELGTQVYEISALKQIGIKQLIDGIKFLASSNSAFISSKKSFTSYKDNSVGSMKSYTSCKNILDNKKNTYLIQQNGVNKCNNCQECVLKPNYIKKNTPIGFKNFKSTNTTNINNKLKSTNTTNNNNKLKSTNTTNINNKFNNTGIIKINNKYIDYEELITNRYKYISKITERCLYKKKKWFNTTDTLDKIFLSKVFAIPIFVVIMSSIYILSVGIVGKNATTVIEQVMQVVQKIILSIFAKFQAPEWLHSLVINGVIKGVGTVLSFVPQLVILFTCISILESTGYMSRIAFLLDKIFRKIGLSGKALIPFIIGSGCSVPGIMSCKILENEDERKMTSILVPFIPCSAKLPIIALFSSYFFKENAGAFSALLYFLAIIIIILSCILMRKFAFFDTSGAFISELPDYKIPNAKYVLKEVYDRTISFIKRAGTTILLASIVIWFMLSFSVKLDYGVSIEKSILATIGKKISWIFYPMLGINSWEATVSALQGLIAKEQVVSSMSIIGGFEQITNISANVISNGNMFNKASALSFVVFNLFSAPCFAAIATMKKELGSTWKMLMAILYQTTASWVIATLIYQLFSIAFFYKM